jgi:8-amino-7-oxononanoate synthase
MNVTNYMQQELQTLKEHSNLRRLPQLTHEGRTVVADGRHMLNLSSNDYLGLAADRQLKEEFLQTLTPDTFLPTSSSSRLLTGNFGIYEELETELATLFGTETALVLNSGYHANMGILPAVSDAQTLILADKLVHASLIDGLQLCKAEWQRFNHNDMDHLERLLVRHRGHYRNVWIVTESIFSMDGDCAPLATLQALKTKYDLKLYVDEAHAFGVCGPGGRGLAAATGTDCDILVATLGKAIASQGAFVITDGEIREFLVNRLRTLIFSTALPPISLRWSDYVIRRLPQMEPWREHLNLLSHRLTGSPSSTHIIPLMAGENHRAIEMSKKFREAGFWVMPIRYPTVPQGKARVRVSLNAALNTGAIVKFKEVWNSIG